MNSVGKEARYIIRPGHPYLRRTVKKPKQNKTSMRVERTEGRLTDSG